jgi:hypothetical protein
MLALSLQTLGGSGFLQDYPIEQYIRDTKIDTLYEGTTGIQGQDFFFRKVVRDKSVSFDRLLGEVDEFIEATDDTQLKDEVAALRTATDDVRAMAATMKNWQDDARDAPSEVYKVGQNTTRLLMSVGDLIIGYLLTRQAAVALTKIASDDHDVDHVDHDFYAGKLAVARFFAASVLPELTARRAILIQTDNALMDVADGSF